MHKKIKPCRQMNRIFGATPALILVIALCLPSILFAGDTQADPGKAAVRAFAPLSLVRFPAKTPAGQLKTGLTPTTDAERKRIASVLQVREIAPSKRPMAVIPSAVRNINHLPKVGRQYWGACAAWAITYYQKTYYEAKEHGWIKPDPAINPERVMSPAFTYNLANGGDDLGSGMEGNYGYLAQYGAATCATMDPNHIFYEWPSEPQWRDAHRNRIKGFSTLDITTTAGLQTLKEQLAAGHIATFAMRLYNNFAAYPAESPGVRDEVLFENSSGVYNPPGNLSADHALTIVGYDDDKTYRDADGVIQKGALLVVNSWGTTWGVAIPEAGTPGFIWIAYPHFMSKTWGEAYFVEDRIGYTPTHFAVVEFNHGRMSELSANLVGGDIKKPSWTMPVLPASGGPRPMSARVVADFTDYITTPVMSYWLSVVDYDLPSLWSPPKNGFILHFSVEHPDLQPWEYTELPKETVEFFPNFTTIDLNVGLTKSTGTFFENIGSPSSPAAWADMDLDGDQDLVFMTYIPAQQSYQAYLYRNDGNGQFSRMDPGIEGIDGFLAWGDYDRDGLPDLAVSGYVKDGTEKAIIYHNEGAAIFTPKVSTIPAAIQRPAWVDYDNDGDLDLALYEMRNYAYDNGILRIWRNDNGAFNDSGVRLNGQVFGRMAWADYNRDGRIDVALSGTLYKNNGGTFAEVFTFYPGNDVVGDRMPIAWGDYDNDGWMDFAASGYRGVAVFRNNRNDSFDVIHSDPITLYNGSLLWVDLDNDGRQDLLLSGDLLSRSVLDEAKATQFWKNQGNGKFQNMGLNLPGVSAYSIQTRDEHVTVVDYDEDGDQDIFLYGGGLKPYPLPVISHLYENLAADANGLGRPNRVPAIPSGLAANISGSVLHMKWNTASDSETASAGLYYNVRAGSNPGASDVMSGAIWAPLPNSLQRPAISATQLGRTLKPIPSKPIYWSVQAIDAGLRASPWSSPKLYSPSGSKPGDVNQDGVLGSADLIRTIRMAKGIIAKDVALADRNGDGKVDDMDVLYMRRILQQQETPDPGLIAVKRVDAAGGTISADGISVTVPSGAFAQPADLSLRRIEPLRPFGAGSITPSYRVEGAPQYYDKELNISLRADALQPASGPAVKAVISEYVFVPTIGRQQWNSVIRSASTTDRRTYTFTAPVPSGGPQTAPAQRLAQASANADPGDSGGEYKHEWSITLLAGYSEYGNSHFRISYPASTQQEYVENLATYLEAAYGALKNSYSFSYSRRTKWPISVVIKDLKDSVYGYHVPSMLGDNYAGMEFNAAKISDAAEMRVTAGHEFFHLVQGLYDSRNRFSKSKWPSKHYWLDEAAAVWSEKIFSGDSSYVPSVFKDTQYEVFWTGMHEEGGAAGEHGYGMAPLVTYLVKRNGNGFLKKVYDDIYATKTDPVKAINYNADSSIPLWYTSFISDYVRNQLNPFKLTTEDIDKVASPSKWIKIAQKSDIEITKRASFAVPDLGAMLVQVVPTYTTIPPDASFFAALMPEDPLTGGMAAIRYKGAERTHLAIANLFRPGVYKIEAPSLAQFQSQSARLLLALVNDRVKAPYTKKQQLGIITGVVHNRNIALKPATITTGVCGWGYQFPTFTDAGSIEGPGMLDVDDKASYGGMHWFDCEAVGAKTRNIKITYSAAPESSVLNVPLSGGDARIYTFQGLDSYKMEWFSDAESDGTYSSVDGIFNVELDPMKMHHSGVIYLVYDVLEQYYNAAENTLSAGTTESFETPAALFIFMQQ